MLDDLRQKLSNPPSFKVWCQVVWGLLTSDMAWGDKWKAIRNVR